MRLMLHQLHNAYSCRRGIELECLMRNASSGLTALFLTACALNPAPVPVVGDSRAIASLAGDWDGEYVGRDNGRSGSILFRLSTGTDTAHGDVVMVPRPPRGYQPDDDESRLARQHLWAQSRVLSIRFVQVSDGEVSGAIEPYASPDCTCQLITTFQGVLRGNRIDGTYTTRHTNCDMPAEQGKWWAERGRGW
jgi:hypothetical protein